MHGLAATGWGAALALAAERKRTSRDGTMARRKRMMERMRWVGVQYWIVHRISRDHDWIGQLRDLKVLGAKKLPPINDYYIFSTLGRNE